MKNYPNVTLTTYGIEMRKTESTGKTEASKKKIEWAYQGLFDGIRRR